MKIGITGASGFIGKSIIQQATTGDRHQVVGYSRSPGRAISGTVEVRDWSDPAGADYSGLDVMIHLAGESILGLWTDSKKKAILDSRVEGTRGIVEAISKLAPEARPKTLVCASAVGFYGDRGDEVMAENAAPGEGFLSEVTKAWEVEAEKAEAHGLRVAMGRIGLVLGRDGGAVPKLRLVFKAGLGGEMGSGDQWWPWVHVADIAKMFLHCAETDAISGPVNFTGPESATNEAFTRTIGEIVNRPTFFKVPTFALNLAPGGMGEIFLNSQRTDAAVLRESGYAWAYPKLEGALREAL